MSSRRIGDAPLTTHNHERKAALRRYKTKLSFNLEGNHGARRKDILAFGRLISKLEKAGNLGKKVYRKSNLLDNALNKHHISISILGQNNARDMRQVDFARDLRQDLNIRQSPQLPGAFNRSRGDFPPPLPLRGGFETTPAEAAAAEFLGLTDMMDILQEHGRIADAFVEEAEQDSKEDELIDLTKQVQEEQERGERLKSKLMESKKLRAELMEIEDDV